MAVKLTIGGIDFEAVSVPLQTAEHVLADPTVARALWRDVWRWDAAVQEGKALDRFMQEGAAPLPNAVVFHVARSAPNGAVIRDEKASKRMGERVLEETGAGDMTGLNRGISKVTRMPRKVLPLERFAPLNPAASYKLRMQTGFDVVLLKAAEERLAFHLCLPGRVTFHHEITEIRDQAAFEEVLAEQPEMRNLQVTTPVPAGSKANAGLRGLALRQRLGDLRTRRQRLPDDAGGAVAAENLDRRIAATEEEARMISRPQKAQ